MKKLKLFFALLMLFTFSVGNVWGYTITFKTGSGDGTKASGTVACSTVISEGTDYLETNVTSFSNAYYAGGSGLKLGTSSGAGNIKLTLANAVTPTSVVVRAKQYNSTKATTVKINNESTQSLTADFKDYTFNITSNITYVQITTSKYAWVESVTVNTSAGNVDVTGVSLNKSTTSIEATMKETLVATITPNNATNKSVTWTSDKESVATVANGVVTGVAPGTANITVTTVDGGFTASCEVTVTAHTITPGTYDVALNSTTYGVAAQTSISEAIELTQNDITVETGYTSGTKPRIDATYVRYYNGSYMLVSVPSGYEITAMTLLEPESGKSWDGSVSADVGTYTDDTKSWVGKAQTVTLSFGATNRCAGVTVTYDVAAAPEPTVYAKQGEDDITELDLGTVGKDFAKSATFSLSGENLTAGNNISLAVSAGFSVVPTSVSVTASDLEAQTITVSKNTTTVGNITDGTLTISSDDFDDVVLTLKMDVVAPFVTPSTASIDFGTVLQHADAPAAQTFTVSGSYLKSKVQIAAPEGFSVDVTELTPDETGAIAATTITVTPPSTATSGDFEGNIVISSKAETPEFTAVNVATSMSVTARYAITPSIIGTGTVTWTVADDETANPQYALAGKTVTVGATAGDGYEFGSLALSDNVTEKEIVDDVAEFTMPASDVTITAVFTESEDPYLTASPAEIDFGTISYKGELAAQTFTIEGGNLKGDKVTIAWEDGSDEAAFALSATEVAISEGAVNTTITVTPRRDVCGNFAGQLNISTTGVATQTVTLGLNVNKLAANLSWSADSYTATIGEENTYPTLSNPRGLENVVYSSLDEDVATVDASTGAITLVGAGETYIIANFAGNDTVVALAKDVLYYTLTVQQTYTAKWYVNGNELMESAQTAVAGTALTIPADPSATGDCEGLVFRGWITSPLAKAKDEAPEFVTTEGLKMPSNDINYYAVFAEENITEQEGDPEWVATAYADLATDDVVVVTITKPGTNAGTYALPNDNGATSAPTATTITITDNQIDAPADNLQWDVVKDGDNITFNVHGSTTSWLFCKNTNNGVRVGNTTEDTDATNKVFMLSDGDLSKNYYLKSTTLTRYIGVYNAQDWRCYGSINSNLNSGEQELTFFKKTVSKTQTTTYSGYLTTCPSCGTVTLSAASVEHGSIALSKESVKTCEAAEVTVTATPDPGYELDDIELSGVAGATYSKGVISIPQDAEGTLTVTASFAAVNYTVTMTQEGGASSTISENQDNKHIGDEITITATAVDGYYFIGWEANVEVTFADAKALSTTFSMPASDVTVTAKFTKILSVAEAIAIIDADKTATTSDVVVEAYVSSIYSTSVTSSGQISYYIKDIDENGFLTGTEFEAYNGKGINGAAFENLSEVEIGAKVRIFGSIKYFSSYDIYEFNSNNYQLSYVAPENPSVVVYGTAAKTAYEVGDSFEFDGLSAKTAYDNKYATAIAEPVWAADPATIAANTESVNVTANGEGAKNIDVTVLTHELSISATNGTVVVEYQGAAVEDGEHFVKGDVLTITATPSADYALNSLTVNGDAFVSGNTYEVGTVDIAVEATFTEKATAQISWGKDSETISLSGDAATLQTLTNDESLTVTYSSDNTDVATISNEEGHEGEITIKAVGTTNISAIFAGNETYKATTVSYELTVTCATLAALDTVYVTDITCYGATFNWDYDAIANADGYYLEVALYDDPTDIKAQLGGLTKVELPLSVNYLLAGTHYVYKVRAFSNDEVNYCDNGWGETYVGDFTTAAPPTYSLKNNWNGGEWAWKEMTYVDGEYILENVVFGGTGVNWRQGDSGDGTWVELASFEGDNIQAWDTVTLAFNPYRKVITATLNSRAVVEFGGSWTQDWSKGKIKAVVSSDNTYAAVKKELTKGDWYNFKPVVGGHWLGCSDAATGIDRTKNSVDGFVYEDGDNHIYFYADVTGEYEFKWVYTTNTVIVTFPDHTYTVAWSLNDGADEALGELEKMGDSDDYTKYFYKDVLSTGAFNVKVFEDDATTAIATTTLNIAKVGKYYLEFDFHYNGNESTVTASATYDQEPTGVDETGDGQKAVKVMKDNTIYIIRGDKTYTITGQVVK